jgi:hypothetical protein
MWQPFTLTQQSWTDNTIPKEKMLPSPSQSSADWPMGLIPVSLPTTIIEAVGLSQQFVDEHTTLVYWAHISSI